MIFTPSGSALAVDDGARAYWNARSGTHVVSFQYLHWGITAGDAEQFDPAQYIYPNTTATANIFIANYAHHFTFPLLKKPSSISAAVAGGSVDVKIDTDVVPGRFLPPGVARNGSFSQSSTGFTDPNTQLVVNLFGTPPLKSGVDLLNYEPTLSVDAAFLLAFPIGAYDDDKLVNIGLNRWYGRIAFPSKYHFRVFSPGYMSSIEVIPSVWLFAKNDDFLGQKLENDPLWQLEAHWTHDFTPSFTGSLDLLYRAGFKSEINGKNVGDKLDIGNLGFTLHFKATDNLAVRTGFSSNLFGDKDVDNSLIRIQFVYAWHPASENMKKLTAGH
jgi:hypothetical protein